MKEERTFYQRHHFRPNYAGTRRTSGDPMRDWAWDSPLWRWRREHNISRAMAAVYLGVSNTAVWYWEHGGASPAADRWPQLVNVLGPEVVEQWAEWAGRRPGAATWSGGRVAEAGVEATAEMEAAADALFEQAVAEEGDADRDAGGADADGGAAG